MLQTNSDQTMDQQFEQKIECPYCGESIDVLLDPTVESQSYIEDCQVCCQAIRFDVVIHGDTADVAVYQENE